MTVDTVVGFERAESGIESVLVRMAEVEGIMPTVIGNAVSNICFETAAVMEVVNGVEGAAVGVSGGRAMGDKTVAGDPA